jgi:hypothetical protein
MICGGEVENDGKDWSNVSAINMAGSQIFEFDERTQELSVRGTLSKPSTFKSTASMTLKVDDSFFRKYIKDKETRARLLDSK